MMNLIFFPAVGAETVVNVATMRFVDAATGVRVITPSAMFGVINACPAVLELIENDVAL